MERRQRREHLVQHGGAVAEAMLAILATERSARIASRRTSRDEQNQAAIA